MPSIAYNILHITDFHIKDSKTGVLRNGYYDEYIDALFDLFPSEKIQSIDYVFLTGDFADKDSELGYEHAHTIVKYLIDKSSVLPENVMICVGNHDFTREMEIDDKDHSGARKNILELKSKYVLNTPLESSDHFDLYDLGSFHCLNLDSTYGTTNKDRPGELSGEQIDEIVTAVKNLDEVKPLHIITHFPFIDYPGRPDFYEEEDWHNKHFWKSGIPIYTRIKKIYDDVPMIIYNGDIHHSDHFQFENVHTISCGSFGNSSKNQSRQAKVIQLENHSISEIVTFNWNLPSHDDKEQFGDWEPVPRRKVRAYDFDTKKIGKTKNNKTTSNIAGLIQSETSNRIAKAFKSSRIFHFGRHSSIDKEKVSLGWMDINRLMNESNLLPIICEDLSTFLKTRLEEQELDGTDSVILGMDCWGNALSGIVSVMTNIASICFPARGLSKYYSFDELLTDRMIKIIEDKKLIVYVCDVVSTGNTCRDFVESLNKKIDLKDKNIIVYSTLKVDRTSNSLDFAESHIFSALIKIPVLDYDDLPEEGIWPTDIFFRTD